MAVLDRPKFSLWLSNVLPADAPRWELMATADNREELEQKKASLRPLLQRRLLCVLEGDTPPRWEPKL
jgi:hypothetical protein